MAGGWWFTSFLFSVHYPLPSRYIGTCFDASNILLAIVSSKENLMPSRSFRFIWQHYWFHVADCEPLISTFYSVDHTSHSLFYHTTLPITTEDMSSGNWLLTITYLDKIPYPCSHSNTAAHSPPSTHYTQLAILHLADKRIEHRQNHKWEPRAYGGRLHVHQPARQWPATLLLYRWVKLWCSSQLVGQSLSRSVHRVASVTTEHVEIRVLTHETADQREVLGWIFSNRW